jgi:methyltransferase (TIGR00027 family)
MSSASQPLPRPPSKTAVWTAIARAIGAKHPDPELRNPDHLAASFVGPRERALLPDYPTNALDLDFERALARLPDPGFVAANTALTKHVDATMAEAIRLGARQVVVLGAGLDSRGYRFEDRLRGVRFLEVDAGPTQVYKQRRVGEVLGRVPAHVRYVPVDFTRDDLLTELRAGGYAEADLTFFIWEGVAVYLPEGAVRSTLGFVRGHAAPGSTIFFNYVLSGSPLLHNPDGRTARWGEPMIFGFPGASAAGYVDGEGLAVVSDLSYGELAAKYLSGSAGAAPPPAPAPSAASAATVRYCLARVPQGAAESTRG